MLPKISIVIPVFNRATMLEKAIRCVLDQGYPNTELIIIDGGSTDGTVDVIKRYESHIAYWHSKKDGSSYLAVNLGIEKATGDLIGLLMDDDWYEPNTFFKIAKAYEAYPNSDIFTPGCRVVNQQNETQAQFLSAKALRLDFYNIAYGHTPTCIRFYKKNIFQTSGLFRPFNEKGERVISSDKEFLMQTVLDGAQDQYVDHLGYTFLSHAQSATYNDSRQTIIKLCIEHMEIAKRLMRDAKHRLSFKQKLFLLYWYNDQSIRLTLYQLLEGKLTAAWDTFKRGFVQYHIIWSGLFFYTIAHIVFKRIGRLFLTGSVKKQYRIN